MAAGTNIQPRRFLFVVQDGSGSTPPEVEIARRVAERGHAVRVLCDPSMADDIRAIGATVIPYVRAPHRVSRAVDNNEANAPDRNRVQRVTRQRDSKMFGPALAYAEDLLAELEREPADVLAIDEGLFGALAAAEKVRIPTAVLIPHCFSLPAPGRPAPGLGFLPARGPLGRLRDAIVWRVVERLYASGLPALNIARSRLGLEPLHRPFDQIMRMDRLLLLTSRAFDYQVGAIPSHARYVGPPLNDPPWVSAWESPWPAEHPDPLVIVGVSTVFRGREDAMQRVIDALAGLPVRALVALGPKLDAGRFRAPANVALRSSVPYAHLFPEASAVVTHAGHGTVIKALAHGVPLVCLPGGQDEPDNAARVVMHGAGLRLSRNAKAAALREAIRRVVEEPHFRQNARRIGALIAEEANHSLAVEELEALIPQTKERAVGATAHL